MKGTRAVELSKFRAEIEWDLQKKFHWLNVKIEKQSINYWKDD